MKKTLQKLKIEKIYFLVANNFTDWLMIFWWINHLSNTQKSVFVKIFQSFHPFPSLSWTSDVLLVSNSILNGKYTIGLTLLLYNEIKKKESCTANGENSIESFVESAIHTNPVVYPAHQINHRMNWTLYWRGTIQ